MDIGPPRPCGYCSSVSRGDRRKRLKEEETKHHNQKIYAGLHKGIDKKCFKTLHGDISLLKVSVLHNV